MDSGISLNGDTISSPDSDNSSQHHIQNQSVSKFMVNSTNRSNQTQKKNSQFSRL